MRFHRLRSPRFALLAFLLLALRLAGGMGAAFLVPAAHVQGDGDVIVICTAMGMSVVEAETDAPPESHHHAMGTHCPFCLASHDLFVLPSADVSFSLPELAATAFLSPSSSGFQPPRPDSRHAPPRAPPSFA
ncbi:MAG: DUF2946 family protein [Zoogloeaceae bacterium]|jgi:hypothetical protein|nr:DUF2946 family protein [Zoogloeaceae bacterium]